MLHIRDVEMAAHRLRDVVHHLPITRSRTFSEMSDADVYLKYENQQKTGSFKVRGAYNTIAKLIEDGEKPAAVVASSAGNHAQGVAFAATTLGIESTIVMPRAAPLAKVVATEEYGARVVLHGECYDDAYAHALEIQEKTGAVFIHPFNNESVMAGQATIALEILQNLPTVEAIVVPAGGGGLLAGMAFCIKHLNPRVEVIGVQAEGAPALVDSFACKVLQASETVNTITDGIAVKQPGDLTFSYICKHVDRMVTVSDEEVASAILLLLERDKQVVEPAGAAALAAILSGAAGVRGKKTVCVLSGGNIDVSFIHRVVEKGLLKRGRQIQFRTVLIDQPGSLVHLSSAIAECGANIIMVRHDRMSTQLNLNEANIHLTCEVSGQEHGKRLIGTLEAQGYRITLE